jgi:hypothetical protein
MKRPFLPWKRTVTIWWLDVDDEYGTEPEGRTMRRNYDRTSAEPVRPRRPTRVRLHDLRLARLDQCALAGRASALQAAPRGRGEQAMSHEVSGELIRQERPEAMRIIAYMERLGQSKA